LDYAKNPVYGSNPIIAPAFMPHAVEHLKQHLVLWYGHQMKYYVEGSLGRKIEHYNEPEITSQVDKLFALSSQHVEKDSQEVFSKVLPVLQAMVEQAAKYKPEPPMEPGDVALLKAAMAETERRTKRDQADIQLKAAKDKADNILKTRDQQIEVALNAVDNLTDERIHSAELSHNAAQLQHEQEKTALSALQGAQQSLGVPKQ
jgi:hypothetical protein